MMGENDRTGDGGDGLLALGVLIGSSALGALASWATGTRPFRRAVAPPGPGRTEAASVAPERAPTEFADAAAVDRRFGEVRELYRMGRLSPPETLSQIRGLASALERLLRDGTAGEAEVRGIVARMDSFYGDVLSYMESRQTEAEAR